ncbi:MAG: HAMP domain-containing sensor histidine kinase [Longimicrobiales bacterium]|nr:HAMP domain-containing sensor histidine kinase [Longimicrobiales bacterium]
MNLGPSLPRGSLLLGFLGATMILALWLAYEAADAARSHERAVESALNDYAGISAWAFARAVRSEVDDVLRDAFRPIRRRMGGDLPPVEAAGWDLHRAAQAEGCPCPGFADPVFLFRITSGSGGRAIVETVPTRLDADAQDVLTSLIAAQPMGRRSNGIVTVPAGTVADEDLAIGFLLARDGADEGDVTYGFAVRATDLGDLVDVVYRERALLPHPIARGQPNDSLLVVRIRDGEGLVVWASDPVEPHRWTATEALGADFGTLVAEATIRTEAAPQLIIGGVPSSRLPLLVFMLLLTLGLGAAAFVQQRREQRFQQLRDDFVSGVSHELRTPLAQIQMFSELQNEGKLLTREDQGRAVRVINREARRLSHLVENILQFTRLRRTSGLGWPKEELDLADACADGIDAVVPLLEDRGMRIEVDADCGLVVHANRDALSRIVVNLLDNAIKYGAPGQTIGVEIGGQGEYGRIAVSDEGPGVPPADRDRLWKPYRRLSREVEASTPGTGIGLAIVADLVRLHDGRTRVEEAAGGGARFVVELPLAYTRKTERTA